MLALCLVLIAAGCTSSNEPASNPAPSAAPPVTPSVTPPVSPSVGSLPYSAARVSIKPPQDGSFLVRGAYPKSQSNCKHMHRGTIEARYPGTLSIRSADDGTLSIVLTLPFERYLEGIAEVPPSWPAAALEAQAVAARSYALAHIGWSGQQGETLQKPICATTDCQVYGGIPVPPTQGFRRWIAAVARTAGHVLLYGGRPADTVYFSTSNGHTYGERPGVRQQPAAVPATGRRTGRRRLAHVPLARGAAVRRPRDVPRAGGVWPDGAPSRRSGAPARTCRSPVPARRRSIDAGTFRDTVNAWASCLMPARYPTDALPTTIPSDWYDASSNAHGATVVGRGWGHGVGLVQWGAYGKAKRGWSADRILAFYYGGLRPTQYPEPGLIHVVVASGLQTLTVRPSAPGATIEGLPLSRATLRLTGDAGVVTVDQ